MGLQLPNLATARRRPVHMPSNADIERTERLQAISRIMARIEKECLFFSGGYSVEERNDIPFWAQNGGNCLNISETVIEKVRLEIPIISAKILANSNFGHFLP